MSLFHRSLILVMLVFPGLAMAIDAMPAESPDDGPASMISPLDDVSWDVDQLSLSQGTSQGTSGPRLDTFDPLEADRPDFTESPSTVGLGRLQIEGGWTYLHDRSAGIDANLHSLPELLLRYGVTERIEFRLSWLGYLNYRDRDIQTGEIYSFDGSSDLWIGCKLQITDESGWQPRSALIASVKAPIGVSEWTSHGSDTILNYNYGWGITDKLSLAGSTGTWWTQFEGDHYAVMHQSAVVGLGITERLGCYLEWFGLFFHGTDDVRPDHYLDGGFTYLVTEDFQLDWRLGVGLNESADDLFTGIGFAVRR